MNNKKLVQHFYLLLPVIFMLFFTSACNEYEEPPLINDPNKVNPTKIPVINNVTPNGTAVAGVREITIEGENFTSGDTTWVVIGSNISPIIKSISDTKIEIYRPPNFGNSLDIKVVVPSADGFGKVSNYNIEVPIDSFQTFTVGSGLPDFFVMEIDKHGTFWTCAGRRIDKVTSDGLFYTNFKDRFTGLGTAFNTFTDLKFGRGGYLYALVGRAEIYLINPLDSLASVLTYATLPVNTSKLDFNSQGNIYTGGSNGVYLITPNTDLTGTPISTGHYSGVTIVEIRVFNDHLYVADSKNVWRNVINPDGTLGPDESLVKLSDISELDTCIISSFNIDIDGRIFLCIQEHSRYSLFVLESSVSVTPFYVDNILPLNVKQILWGYKSRYMYLNRSRMITTGMRVFHIGMDKVGAPNYGRDF